MGTGFGNDSDQGCKNYHKDSVVAYPSVNIDILQSYTDYEKDAECPKEYCQKMFLYDVIPEMLLNEMI